MIVALCDCNFQQATMQNELNQSVYPVKFSSSTTHKNFMRVLHNEMLLWRKNYILWYCDEGFLTKYQEIFYFTIFLKDLLFFCRIFFIIRWESKKWLAKPPLRLLGCLFSDLHNKITFVNEFIMQRQTLDASCSVNSINFVISILTTLEQFCNRP